VTSLKWPEGKQVLIKSISQLKNEKEEEIKNVQMLGCKEKLSWEMGDKGLYVLLPKRRPNPNGYVLKITFNQSESIVRANEMTK
jgi:hypothetical protein